MRDDAYLMSMFVTEPPRQTTICRQDVKPATGTAVRNPTMYGSSLRNGLSLFQIMKTALTKKMIIEKAIHVRAMAI